MIAPWFQVADISLGPRLTLEVEIVYEQFLATGTPSGMGFEGGFVVDEVDAYALAINLGTNPKETLVKLQATRFESSQVINLVNAAADLDIDKPDREIIRFQDVNVYASPLGCIIGTQVYPPGFVVQGKAFILDKKVEIDCRIGSEGLKLKGEIEGFTLGPLAIRGGKCADGTQGENAFIDFEITKERQCFELSGSVALWDLEAGVFVKAQIMPDPELEFNFELAWSDLIKFQVDGKLIKPEPADRELEKGGAGANTGALANLEDADFQLHALMEQRILTEISEAMQKWFASAQASVDQGIEEAKRKVDEAKLEFERKCEEAKQEVKKTQASLMLPWRRPRLTCERKRKSAAGSRLRTSSTSWRKRSVPMSTFAKLLLSWTGRNGISRMTWTARSVILPRNGAMARKPSMARFVISRDRGKSSRGISATLFRLWRVPGHE